MDKLDFSSVDNSIINEMAGRLGIFMGALLGVGIILIILFKLLRVPNKLASFLSTCIMLYTAYLLLTKFNVFTL
ncbi:hypothetical protein [Terribacillus aidingensis]|uniref:hypothetical protein n=1 Tax=Terribacillus aidingensis TaxID=586416 RepID=UPI00344FD567